MITRIDKVEVDVSSLIRVMNAAIKLVIAYSQKFTAIKRIKPLIDLIKSLDLQPHPEGGWYREVYRSDEAIPQSALPDRFVGARRFATSIYFLLSSESFSALHRIQADEQWHFYTGSPLTIHVLHPNGLYTPVTLGSALHLGQTFQAVVPHGCWFGATVAEPDCFALVGCSVAPGFDFADFELGERDALTAKFPDHAAVIARLTRK